MNSKAALLERLRIERDEVPATTPANSRRRQLAIGSSALLLIAATALILRTSAQSDALTVQDVLIEPVSVAGADNASLGTSLDASGYVVALRQATVSAKNIFKVQDVLVQQGERVQQGQVIARLDGSNVHAALLQAQAQVRQLEATLAAARLAAADARPSYVRYKRQLDDGLISADAFDVRTASYNATQSAVRVAEQNLEVAKAGVVVNQRYEDDTVIRAPFDGIVTSKNAQPGEIVSPQFVGGGGIATLVDMSSLEVEVDVSESYISRVHPAQAASITLNAYPDWHIPAEVVAIIPTADRSKATVQVRVAFRQKDDRILPQMGAHVSFLSEAAGSSGERTPDATTHIMVPAAAVGEDAGGSWVYVIQDGRLARRSVRPGELNNGNRFILSGLEPGTHVAVGNFRAMHDGAKVRIGP